MRKIIFLLLLFMLIIPMMGYTQAEPAMEQKELQTAHGTWRYLTHNSGQKAVLFIHGAGSSRQIWKKQYNLLLVGYKSIFVDLLGYGASDKPDSTYSLENWLAGLHLILEQEQVEQVCIVGHSNGVIFAKEYYRTYPEQVSHLLLLDGQLKQMIQPPLLEWMRSTLQRNDYEKFMESNIERMPVQGLAEADAEVLKADGRNTPKRIHQAELDLVSDAATWEALVLRCPVTIVHANNPFWTESYIDWLREIAPRHELLEWKDAGHFIPLQYPERLNALIERLVMNK